jgi:hypothetical protein
MYHTVRAKQTISNMSLQFTFKTTPQYEPPSPMTIEAVTRQLQRISIRDASTEYTKRLSSNAEDSEREKMVIMAQNYGENVNA